MFLSPKSQKDTDMQIRWVNDLGKNLIKGHEFSIGGIVVEKTTTCTKCNKSFDLPINDFEKEWEKVIRNTNTLDMQLCRDCDAQGRCNSI